MKIFFIILQKNVKHIRFVIKFQMISDGIRLKMIKI